MKITKKELIKTAKELNELMGLDPAIPTAKDTEDSVLMEKIGEAAEMLEEDDEISEVAQEVIDYIAEQQEEAEEAAEETEEAPEEAEEEQTTEQLVEESDYKALKAMVAEYPEFKGIDIALFPAKKVEELRERMLKVLSKKAGKKEPEAAAPAKKGTGEKKITSKDALPFLTEMISKKKYTTVEIAEKAHEKFPTISESTFKTLLVDGRNPKYNKFDKLVKKTAEGILSF